MRKFCIRGDYRHNEARTPARSAKLGSYWTEQRIREAGKHQYQVYALARSLAARQSAASILDIGCGPGVKLKLFFGPEFRITGLDTDEGVAACVRLGQPGRYLPVDLGSPPDDLADRVGTPDIVICADVIEHVCDPDVLMRLIARFCRPETTVVLSTPSRDELLGRDARHPSNPEHCREWSTAEFAEYVAGHGFRILDHRLQPPFRFGADWMTVRFLVGRLVARRKTTTTQVIVCRRQSQ